MIWDEYKEQCEKLSTQIRVAAEMLFYANQINFQDMHDIAMKNLEKYTEEYQQLQKEFWNVK